MCVFMCILFSTKITTVISHATEIFAYIFFTILAMWVLTALQ